MNDRDNVTRARKYLERMPPAIEGQGGSSACYAAAVVLVHGFCLDEEVALSVMMTDYNPRCEGPWSESALRHKVRDAAEKQHREAYGYLLNSDNPAAGSRRKPVSSKRPTRGTPRKSAATTAKPTYPTWQEAHGHYFRNWGKPVTAHEYRQADGTLVGIIARYATPEGKEIRPAYTADGGLSWVDGGFPTPRPLLYLADVLAAETIIVAEGEKCADAVRSLNLIATTAAHGAQSPHLTDWSPMRGKRVVILVDHDDDGEKYAATAGRLSLDAGAIDVRIARLATIWPEISAAGDVADWIEHRDAAEPDIVRAELEALIDAAEPWRPEGADGPELPAAAATGDQAAAVPAQRLVLVKASEIPCTPINWLWPQRIVGDGLTIITGPVGVSKSLISVDVASRVSTGHKWPDGTGSAPLGTVILFGAEDDAGKVVVPRLKAAGADLERVLVCQGTAGDTEEPENVILERHIDQLRAALDTVTDCRLIVFDPLPDYLAADENSSREVRAALMPLARLAQERNVAVVAVLHQNKKTDLTTVQRIAGSGAFVQIARIVLAIGIHPEDMDAADGEKRRVMLVSKSNYGQRDVGQAYAIETRSNGSPGVVWHAGEITIDADSLSRRPTGGGQHEDRRSEAVDALREMLEVGEKNAGAITEEMQDRGFGRRLIDHAKEALNVVGRKQRDGWYWRLPKGNGHQAGSSGAVGRDAAAGAARFTEFDAWSGEAQAAEIARS